MLYFEERFKYLLQKHNNNIELAGEELKEREINEQVRNGQLRTQSEINNMSNKIDQLFKNKIVSPYLNKK